MSIVRVSISLDGFTTGPDDTIAQPMGAGGEQLHNWIFGIEEWRQRQNLIGGTSGNADAEVVAETFANVGAYVMGRRMFDHGEAPWGDSPPFQKPVFVVTHRPRETLAKQGGTTFYFVDSVETAFQRAKEAAGDQDVTVAGGADILQQAMLGGFLDELQVPTVPVLLGGGRRLFENLDAMPGSIQIDRVAPSADVTHIRYRIIR